MNTQNMVHDTINKIFIWNFFEFDIAEVQLHKVMPFLNRKQLGLHYECPSFYTLWANFVLQVSPGSQLVQI